MIRNPIPHQYIERKSSQIKTEKLYRDSLINLIYNRKRENYSKFFKFLSSARISDMLGFLNYDMALGTKIFGLKDFTEKLNIDLSESLDSPESLDTARKIFERKIRYWETRSMPESEDAVVSPADAKILVGSFSQTSYLFLKEKFFEYEELLSPEKKEWISAFDQGDFAVFRLTPDKYHYNHTPVTGKVIDIYEISGNYYPCNPGAVMNIAAPYSKNKRVVTIIDTDIKNGTQVGLTAMIEIAALMIGDILQCYSEYKYDSPMPVQKGMILKKGQPKSLYRPGSSTDLLIFQKGKISFSPDIVMNMFRSDVQSRFSDGLGRPLAETEVSLRSQIGSVKS